MNQLDSNQTTLQMSREPDIDPFEEWVPAHWPRVLVYIVRHFPVDLRDLFDPQDILQDVLFEAARRFHTFKPDGEDAPYRWLVTIARNRLTSLLRMRNAAKRAAFQRIGPHDEMSIANGLIDLVEQWAVYRRTPSKSAAAHELIANLERSIDRLPEHYRQTIRLRHVDGLSLEQTAERMNLTTGAANMLYRALRTMRSLIDSASMDA